MARTVRENGALNLRIAYQSGLAISHWRTAYNAYRRRKRQSARSVRHITNSELIDIYRSRYWDAVKGDELPSGLDYVIYRALTSTLRPEKEDRRASIQQPCLLNPRHVA